ncbi:MAG TPA: hypothetical protein VJ570_02770 [Holophagaceae bacterium]|nr:hypothetical protein [Holophagaceae bacterium]
MARYLPTRPHAALDAFGFAGSPHPVATVGGFWQWAFSNFADNTVRGILAEYLVGTALGCDMSIPRDPWDDYDLLTPDGIRVEVKTTGRVQSWHSRNASPSFGGLKGRRTTADGASSEGQRAFRADVYVFALQTADSPEELRPLDLGQWRFWVVPRSLLARLDQRSIRLSRVMSLGREATFHTLPSVVLDCRE